jgi:hypothetical protein
MLRDFWQRVNGSVSIENQPIKTEAEPRFVAKEYKLVGEYPKIITLTQQYRLQAILLAA